MAKTKKISHRTTAKNRAKSTQSAKSKSKAANRKGLLHHAKHVYRVTPKFVHGMVVGAFVGILVVIPLSKSGNADALSISTVKDCDSYSIIYCGVQSTSDIKSEYGRSAYIADVFKYFTISSNDIDTINKTSVKGTVYDNGNVSVNGKVVATNAVTAARKSVTSKDKKVTYSGSTFYTRTIKSAWSHTSASAYVVMKNGVFDYAILAPCGNPIIATAKPGGQLVPTPSTSKPVPNPPAITTPPTPGDNTPSPKPSETGDTNITPPSNTTTPVTMTAVSSLPKTGVGSVAIVFAIAAFFGTVFHLGHHRAKKRRQHRHHAA